MTLVLIADSLMTSNIRKVFMKTELKQSGYRHATKLIAKMSEIIDVPEIVKDAIRIEMEYATLDGYRITMRNTRNGDRNDDQQDPIG